MKKYVKFNDKFNLITQEVNTGVTVEVAKYVSHIIVIDVSGSMYYDLPEIRKNLKNKISSLVKENDTVSIIWFSGKNDAGILKEEVYVNSLKQLNDLNDAIDRFLKPIGLTAFAKPLELANNVIGRIQSNNPESIFSLIFMSDGWNNDVSWDSVINAVNKISPKLSSSVVVEYGFYADSLKLTEISDIFGGEKISCSGFEEYDVVIGKNFKKTLSGGKKTIVNIIDNYLYNFAFSVSADGSILMYNINENKIVVGSDVKEIYFFSPTTVGVDVGNIGSDTILYAAIYTLSERLYNEDAEKIFYALGDQHHYQMLVNAFGKQKLNAFKAAIKECVADSTKRFPAGQSTILPVPDDAYCLMNLIEDLTNTDGCLFYPNHEDFNYSRIGAKRVARGEDLSAADKKRLAEAKNVTEIQEITKELAEKNVAIEFKNSNPERGYPLTDLVWNSERANLSVRIYIEGEAIVPENKFDIDKVSSFKYNTFTLVKDGIINVQKLPVIYSAGLEKLLIDNNVKFTCDVKHDAHVGGSTYGRTIVIDLTSIPLVNRGMVKAISANELAKKEWELKKLQGDKKVYDFYRKELFPKTSKSFVELLGQEATDWLKTVGVTDYNGFAPLTDAVESTDFYMSVNLATKIKGLSGLPKVEDVKKKLESGAPLKLNEYVMADALTKYLAQLDSDIYKSLSEEQQKGVLKTYLETKSDILNKRRRKVLQEIAEIKFSLILSKKNFIEFKSFDENKLSLNLDGKDLDFTFEFSEKEVGI